MKLLFVYGTLLRGMSRSHYLQDKMFLEYGILQNANMYDLGNYPGIIFGTGTVYGEVYEISEKTLTTLDAVEGYNSVKKNGLYLRKKVNVQMFNGEIVEVETYFYNYPIEGEEEISCGDYRRHLAEKNDKQWYVAYGSNLNTSRLRKRIGDWDKTYTGEIEDYKLVFNKEGSTDGEVYANAKYTGIPEDALPFVVYEVSTEQLKILDGFEGEPVDYVRVGIPIKVEKQEVIGQIYIAHPSKLTTESIPTAKYMRHLRKGYKYWGLADKYGLGINEASSDPQDSEIDLPF